MKLNAQLWSFKKDYEDEVTMVFKIPSREAEKAVSIPVQRNLILDITEGYQPQKGEETTNEIST